jgi:hypothetical protein
MNQPVPDLTRPYSTAGERAHATVVVIRYWQLVEQLMKLVDTQPDGWSAKLESLFPASVPGGPPEHPQQRLERWFAVYADDIKILRTIRNRRGGYRARLPGARELARTHTWSTALQPVANTPACID